MHYLFDEISIQYKQNLTVSRFLYTYAIPTFLYTLLKRLYLGKLKDGFVCTNGTHGASSWNISYAFLHNSIFHFH